MTEMFNFADKIDDAIVIVPATTMTDEYQAIGIEQYKYLLLDPDTEIKPTEAFSWQPPSDKNTVHFLFNGYSYRTSEIIFSKQSDPV